MIDVAEPILSDDERENVLSVLESGNYVQGAFVDEFERKWAAICDVDHAIAVSNGTTALHLTLEALGIGTGDRVAVPALSFGATAEAVYHAGAEPIFVDVREDTHTMDPDDLRTVATAYDLDGVIPVHLYGHPAAMDPIREIARDHDVPVVEDAAQAHGAAYDGTPVGGLGRAGCFSFYATKNVTSGEGGMITTNDDDLAAQLRLRRNHGMDGRDDHEVLGWNYRLSELHAALGAAQADRLEEFNDRRDQLTRTLRDRLADIPWLEPLAVDSHVDHAWFWAPFATRTDEGYLDGKRVRAVLADHGVETRHRYTAPLQSQSAFETPVERPLPVASRVAGNVIGLPNHPGLDGADIETVVRRVREASSMVEALRGTL